MEILPNNLDARLNHEFSTFEKKCRRPLQRTSYTHQHVKKTMFSFNKISMKSSHCYALLCGKVKRA
jgi:hypothetical protein